MPVEIIGEVGTSGADPEWISAQATLAIRHIIKRAILPPHYRSRNLAAILIGIAPLASRTCPNPEAVLLPFRSIRSLILVDAKVNGNPATLLLDTGANNTIINAKKYGKVQAPRIEPVSKGPGLVGNVLRLRVDLEIGGWFLFSQPVSVMNLDALPKGVGVQFDGLLGQDIVRQFRSVRTNYRAHVIELEK